MLINNKALLTFQEFQEMCGTLNPAVYLTMTEQERAKLFDLVFRRARKFQRAFDDLKCPPRYFEILLMQFLTVQVSEGLEQYNKLLQAAYAQVVAQVEEPELEESTLSDFLDKRIEK